jgi:hypothetical protein
VFAFRGEGVAIVGEGHDVGFAEFAEAGVQDCGADVAAGCAQVAEV